MPYCRIKTRVAWTVNRLEKAKEHLV